MTSWPILGPFVVGGGYGGGPSPTVDLGSGRDLGPGEQGELWCAGLM